MNKTISTHCKQGHERTKSNLYIAPKTGAIGCRPCRAKATKAPKQTEYRRNYRVKYRFGDNREVAIQRDGEKCVKCGMTRAEHRAKYNRDITVDHTDGRGRNMLISDMNNSLDNLQTLCLRCHGKKDVTRRSTKTVRLTDEDAEDIRMFHRYGLIATEIAKAYKMVNLVTIYDILASKSHKPILLAPTKEER